MKFSYGFIALVLLSSCFLYVKSADCVGCEACQPGYKSNSSDPLCSCCPQDGWCQRGHCVACPAGTYNDLRNATFCKNCSQGFFSGTPQSQRCTPCPPGTYQNETGQQTCDECDPGSFCALKGCDVCELCPLGHAESRPGQITCRSCAPGNIANTTGLTHCLLCPVGFSAPNVGSKKCTTCEPGWFSGMRGSPRCLPCLPGSFSTKRGSSHCKPCPPGTDLPVGNSSANKCQGCYPGTFARYPGTGLCMPCKSGFYSLQFNTTHCDECPARYFCPTPTEKRKCPLESVCPPGTAEPYQCHGPVWAIKMTSQTCVISNEFLAVILGAIGSAVFIVVVCAFIIWRKVSQGQVEEEAISSDVVNERVNLLSSERARGTTQVMYTGL